MTQQAETILARFQVRKSKKEKETFRTWLCGELEAAGYAPTVERKRGVWSSHNVVVGDPEKAEVLFTAHYDTQAVLPFPNFITPRNLAFYLIYQLVFCIVFFALVFVAELAYYLGMDALGVETSARAGGIIAVVICLFLMWWMFDGKANRHTANDNTSGIVTLVETALAMPEAQRGRVCFVFFDNEERGMLGSSAFAGRHKTVKKDTVVLNFDCVGDGDSIQFFPQKALKKDTAALEAIEAAFLPTGGRDVQVVRGFGFYPSDNASFKKAAGVCALKYKKPFGYCMGRIHTAKDTVLEEENIALLRDGCLRWVENLPAGHTEQA